MENFNIETLFGNGGYTVTGGSIDVDTLFSSGPIKSSDELVRDIIIRKRRKLEYYQHMFDSYWNNISELNRLGEQDIVITVPQTIHMWVEYDPEECIGYMSRRFRREQLETYIISSDTLFVTWHKLAEKKRRN